NCTAVRNGDVGIFAHNNSLVMNNNAEGNHDTGINCQAGCLVTNNISSHNGSLGFFVLSGRALGNTAPFKVQVGLNGGVAYGNNSFGDNNGGNQQVLGGIQLGTNQCGVATLCP